MNKIQKRLIENWSDLQLNIWQNIQNDYTRKIIVDKTYIITNLYKEQKIILDNYIDYKFIKEFYNYFIDNIKIIMGNYLYEYIYPQDTRIIDVKGGISFNGFSFSLSSMCESILKNGLYIPLICDRQSNDTLAIVGGRHRIIALKEIYNKRKFLCLMFNERQSDIKCEFTLPTILLEKYFNNYDIIYCKIDKYFSIVYIDNPVDLWILFKLQEKELDLIFEMYSEQLYENNIFGSELLFKKGEEVCYE